MEIAVDFDGTCTTHEFPEVGKDIGAQAVLKELVEQGHKLILFTMRANVENPISGSTEIISEKGNFLDHAIKWFSDNDIPLHGVQSNPSQKTWTSSPKCYAHLYIDDAALGCPLKNDFMVSSRPYVDWEKVRVMLQQQGYFGLWNK